MDKEKFQSSHSSFRRSLAKIREFRLLNNKLFDCWYLTFRRLTFRWFFRRNPLLLLFDEIFVWFTRYQVVHNVAFCANVQWRCLVACELFLKHTGRSLSKGVVLSPSVCSLQVTLAARCSMPARWMKSKTNLDNHKHEISLVFRMRTKGWLSSWVNLEWFRL